MTLNLFTTVLSVEAVLFLVLLPAVVCYQLMNREINAHALLTGIDDRGFSQTRLQLLALTLLAALVLMLQVLSNPTRFPDIPQEVLLFLGGSQMFYLGGKSKRKLRSWLNSIER